MKTARYYRLRRTVRVLVWGLICAVGAAIMFVGAGNALDNLGGF